jgi:hypothetical protein
MDDHNLLKGAGALLAILVGLLTFFLKRHVDQADETKEEHARKILSAVERLDDHGKKIVALEAVRELPLLEVRRVGEKLTSLAGDIRADLKEIGARLTSAEESAHERSLSIAKVEGKLDTLQGEVERLRDTAGGS